VYSLRCLELIFEKSSKKKGIQALAKDRLIELKEGKTKFVSRKERLKRAVKNWNKRYTVLKKDEILSRKQSDTIFILGSGSSINELSNGQWQEISDKDSFGFNYWLVHWHVPTFYLIEYSRYEYNRKIFEKVLARKQRKKKYSNVPFFISSRARKRGLHPRFTPELFTDDPKIFYFPFPKVLNVPNNDVFRRSDFSEVAFDLEKRSIMYRGILSNVLGLSCQMGYKTIVLLGVDLKHNRYFYDGNEEMEWTRDPKIVGEERPPDRLHGTMLSKGGRKHPISEFIYALNEYSLFPNGIDLYVGSENSLLAERLEVYPCFL